jgi:hypothetical protein
MICDLLKIRRAKYSEYSLLGPFAPCTHAFKKCACLSGISISRLWRITPDAATRRLPLQGLGVRQSECAELRPRLSALEKASTKTEAAL